MFQLGAAGEDNVFWFRGNPQQGSCFIKHTDTPQSLKMTRDDSTLLSFDPFEIIVRSLSVINNLKRTFLANLETSTCIEDEMSRLTNTFPGLKSSFRHKLCPNHPIKQLFVVPRNKQMAMAQVTSLAVRAWTCCVGAHRDLINFLRSISVILKTKEESDKAKDLKALDDSERREKVVQDREDTLRQVRKSLTTEREKNASLSRELLVLKRERSNFFARKASEENSMQEWILVKELNEKVSHLEEAAKVLKEDAVAKEEAVVKLEGQLENLKKDRIKDQRKVSALKLELEVEKKRCEYLEMHLRRSSQNVQPRSTEELFPKSDNVESQANTKLESDGDKPERDDSVKMEYTEVGSSSGGSKTVKLEQPDESRKRSGSTLNKEELLTSRVNQHEISLTMIASGVSRLLQDENTPSTMLGALRVLKQCATMKYDEGGGSPLKFFKFEQEYFEYEDEKKIEEKEDDSILEGFEEYINILAEDDQGGNALLSSSPLWTTDDNDTVSTPLRAHEEVKEEESRKKSHKSS